MDAGVLVQGLLAFLLLPGMGRAYGMPALALAMGLSFLHQPGFSIQVPVVTTLVLQGALGLGYGFTVRLIFQGIMDGWSQCQRPWLSQGATVWVECGLVFLFLSMDGPLWLWSGLLNWRVATLLTAGPHHLALAVKGYFRAVALGLVPFLFVGAAAAWAESFGERHFGVPPAAGLIQAGSRLLATTVAFVSLAVAWTWMGPWLKEWWLP